MRRSIAARVVTSALLLMLLGGVFNACACEGRVIIDRFCWQNDCCRTNDDCVEMKKAEKAEDPDNWICLVEEQRCIPEVRDCELEKTGDWPCCPGQACGTLQVCGDKMVSCDPHVANSCTVRGQYCEPHLGTPREGGELDPGCTFRRCGENNSCDDDLSCFNGYCVGEPPCQGGCPAGSVCTPVNNQCFRLQDSSGKYAADVAATCQQTCNEGYMLVFENPSNVWGTCDDRLKTCTCLPLPPIRVNDMARYSSSAVTPNVILVAAYDTDHGDLVLHTFSKGSDGAAITKLKTEWVDGVPSKGALAGDPYGPRGGREDAGPDVGQYTSIAYDASSGAVHISYYAVKDGNTPLGNLRYARRINDGAWTIFDVDGVDTGDVGLYTNITLAPDGVPVIAYFQRAGVEANALQTAVKVARAKSATPKSAADWIISTVDTGARTPPPCDNACKADELCADDGATGQCIKKAARNSDCTSACGSNEFCGIDSSSQSVCFAELRTSSLAGLPEGNGLFPSIAYLDATPVLVWYDHTKGQLKGVIATADSAAQGATFRPSDVQVLDDGKIGSQTRAVGQFTSLAVGPASVNNRIAVSYLDATTKQLRVLTAGAGWTNLTPVEQRAVDTGAGEPTGDPLLFVGADSSVRFKGNLLSVVYQDSTGGDLRLAEQSVPDSQIAYKQTLSREGTCGFYAKLLVDGNTRYASHTIVQARDGSGSAKESANRIEVLKLP